MVTETINWVKNIWEKIKKYTLYFLIFLLSILGYISWNGINAKTLLFLGFVVLIIGMVVYPLIYLIKKIPFAKLLLDENQDGKNVEEPTTKTTGDKKQKDSVHAKLEEESTSLLGKAMQKLTTFGIAMLTIALFFLLLWFIGRFKNDAPKLTQDASHTATGTVVGLFYGIKNGYNAQKNLDKINTGDYVPGQATTEGVTVTPGSSEKGSWVLYQIPIKKGFATKVNITKPGAGKYSIAPEGMILYASKPGNTTPDVVINTSENFNLPHGDYCFSAEKHFIQNGSDSCVIQIWAWNYIR